MDFGYTPKVEELRSRVRAFMDAHIVPRIRQWNEEVHAGLYPVSFMEELKARAKAEGLWNLFLPHLKDDEPGMGLTNLEYAPLAEIMGRVGWASEVFNCNAPDTGNMELLHMFATPEQREQWLKPLLRGEIRSAFAMTARRGVVGCDEHHDAHRARGRRVRDQRPQVVHHERRASELQDLHRDGQDRPRGRVAPAAEHDPRAARHAGRDDRAQHHGGQSLRAGRALRDHVRQRARAGAQPAARKAAASRSRRPASGRAASTTACVRSARPSLRWN